MKILLKRRIQKKTCKIRLSMGAGYTHEYVYILRLFRFFVKNGLFWNFTLEDNRNVPSFAKIRLRMVPKISLKTGGFWDFGKIPYISGLIDNLKFRYFAKIRLRMALNFESVEHIGDLLRVSEF